MTSRDAAYFDGWYSAMSVSSRHDAIVQTALGLPPEFESSSLVPWDGSAAAVMCIDAMQFAEPMSAGLAECRRVLATARVAE